MVALNLDLSKIEVEKDSKVDLLPPGDYLGTIVEVECKETSSKSGHILVLLFKILEGEHAGKCFRDNLNIVNTSADSQRISLSRLKGILEKAGYANPSYLQDTDHMIGMTLLATLIDEKYTTSAGKTGVSNKVKKYAAAGTAAPGGTVVATPVTTPVVDPPAAPVVTPAAPAPFIAAPVVTTPTAGAPGAVPAAAPGGQFPWTK